ncbi:RCC1 domain-containing protein [Rutstroemia sp. NJR-2017a WRK4]|nr:RCC1 domain-containing protein [Rutstroemia sp. NJR-2017a WRK4]
MATLYAIGSNGSGQLGIGHREDVSVPKQVLFDGDGPTGIRQIRAGGNHTLILSTMGTLYCSGESLHGACGPGSEEYYTTFKVAKIAQEPSAEQPHTILCAATWQASIIVQKDETGHATKVFSFGTGNKEIVDLAASVSHVVAVLSNGDVYGWGSGRKGQIGEPEGIFHSPRKIENLGFKVNRAVCGQEFTYLLGESGTSQHKILGSDKRNIKSSMPDTLPLWKGVGAGWGSIALLQSEGQLISWGRDDHGQLAPTNLSPLSQIAIGSEHSVALTSEGDVCAWGWGEHGNCGPGTTNGDVKGRWNVIASSKYLPPDTKISYIGAGCATSWIFLS